VARKFGSVLKLAAAYHGGEKSVIEQSANTLAARNLAKVPADRLLSVMTKRVFNAGFNWKVIEAKWEGFEAAFEGFDPGKLAFFGEEMMDQPVSDPRIVRNRQKIKASLRNARFVAGAQAMEGGFGKFLASWPADDQVGLMNVLNARGSRLGGASCNTSCALLGGMPGSRRAMSARPSCVRVFWPSRRLPERATWRSSRPPLTSITPKAPCRAPRSAGCWR